MKPNPLLSALAALWLACTACLAQVPLQLPVTNSFPALSTNTVNVEIGVGDATEVALEWSLALASSVGANSNITATLERSVSGGLWTTYATLLQTASGTTTVGQVTNVTVGAVPKLRIGTVINANTVAVSTAWWKHTKRNR